ncbi:type III effector protein [Ralstonia solanacearum]|nr:type III effector protein [Ralstonia solanacearum]QVX41960.1 type III effector protein [Ralstonia solanacearum]
MGRITSTPGPQNPSGIGASPDVQTSGHATPAPQPLPVGRRSPIQSALRAGLAQAPRTSATALPQSSVARLPSSGERLTPPREIAAPGANEASGSRSAPAHAADLKPVVVLDWDDCLRYEKGMNYQLVHNALEIAASMHAQSLPELRAAVDRLRGRMARGEQPGEGDPLIMQSQEDCANYLAANPGIYKRGMVEDFVRTMLPDVDSGKAADIVSAVYTQCVQEYNRLAAGPRLRTARPCEVPFPGVRIALMPGARELLDTSHAAGSPVMLISNRAHSDLEKEVRYLDMQQDFDVVSGAPTVTRPRSNASAAPMPEALQQRLTAALQGDDDGALRAALEDASAYAHPNTTSVTQTDRKPHAARLLDSLQRLSVPSEAPIILYGDQPSDISQAAKLAETGRRIEGVLIDPGHNDVGRQIDVEGIPTRVIRSLADPDAPWKSAAGAVHEPPLFPAMRTVPFILSRPEQSVPPLPVAAGDGVVYSRAKQALGGSDVGMLAWMDGHEHLVKTGLSRSLLGQIMSCRARGQESEAEKRVGYVVDIWARLSGDDTQKDALKDQLKKTLHAFIQSEKGSRLFEKARSGDLDLTDVSGLHRALTDACPQLKNPLGMPVIFDLVNGVASQALANALQRTYLAGSHVPDATLLVSPDNVLFASRILQDAVPMDAFLTRAFLPQGVSLRDAKLAAARIKTGGAESAELRGARELIARICAPRQLEAGRQGLTAALQAQGMDGFFTSVLARLTIGESHNDLGPDNMLIVPGADGRHKAVNIDVTGFWESRRDSIPAIDQAPPRPGWGEVMAHPEQAADILLDANVLSGRYARGFEAVHEVVVDVLRNTLRDQAAPEAASVRAWYAAQNEAHVLASMSELQHGLRDVAQLGWMVDPEMLEKGFSRNAGFIRDVIGQAKAAQQAASTAGHAKAPGETASPRTTPGTIAQAPQRHPGSHG